VCEIGETSLSNLKDLATAAILAGGLGTRLRSVVADRPKVLAAVRGKPFLAYLLDCLADVGVDRVVLCTGYMGDLVRETFGDSYRSLQILYSQEPYQLGTGGALGLALPLLHDKTILVMNGDSFCQADLAQFWAWHRERSAQASLLLTQVPDTSRYGRVQTDEAGAVWKFEEKGDTRGPGWINAGIYAIERALLESIPSDCAVSLERDLFPQWIGRGLYGYPNSGQFLDIGTPESYAIAEAFFT
jgi:D-glycero-alpha-D-manno-heptose 1-phosphate guanylyltransferase